MAKLVTFLSLSQSSNAFIASGNSTPLSTHSYMPVLHPTTFTLIQQYLLDSSELRAKRGELGMSDWAAVVLYL